ncbi:MAG: hypothetical protein ACK5NC_04695 [Vibrio sp.]
MLNFEKLKQRHRMERGEFSQSLSIRVHRALSWLNKAEMCEDDDSKFTFLWIAFNSAYAQDFDYKPTFGEQGLYQEFLSKLVSIDTENKLYKVVWENYSSSIRLILESEFTLAAYWNFHAGRITEDEWKDQKSKAKATANTALAHNNTALLLSTVFARLYTLRNQIIHGGATFNSSANRKQLRDCTQVLESIVPIIISLMMDGKNEIWGEPVYPLIKG